MDMNILKNKTMHDYDKSFNFFIGTYNENFDWFNNPYI